MHQPGADPMPRTRPPALALLAAFFALLVPALSRAWAQPRDPAGPAVPAARADAPLPTDPRLMTGTLENGLRYIVRRHDNPPGRAAVWMHVSSGSLNETEGQRGIAHFLEHMAFNGSENFPPGSVIPFFQSLGLTFGQHQNAFTSFDQTTYQLALPDNKPETIEKAMRFFSDVAFRLTLPPKEIDNERQVILEERRSRLSGRQRVQDYFFEHLAPGSIFGRRLPIGVEETILGVRPEDFRDYYSRWYTPANITVMAVADADPQAIVVKIREHFAAAPGAPRPVPQDIGVKPYDATRAIVASDDELTDASVGMVWIYPPQPPITTESAYRRDLVETIGSWIFNRRLQRRVSEGTASFHGGGASASDLFRAGYIATITVRGETERWRAMLEELAAEVRRAGLHGFTDAEMEDARKELVASAERQVETEATMPARSILSAWNSAIADDQPILSAQQELDLVRQLIPGITRVEASRRFGELFDASRPVTFTLQMPTSGNPPSEAELVAVGAKALEARPEAEADRTRAAALMDSRPAGGQFSQLAEEPVAQVWSGWLSNNVRVHYRFMDYRKDSVSVAISLAAGEIQETAENRGIAQAASLAWGRARATGALSSTDIRDLMTGKKVSAGGSAGPDTMTLQIAGRPAELETGLQLAYLLLTDPRVEPAALDQWKSQQKQAAELRKKDPSGVFGELVTDTLYPKGEVRVRSLEPEHVERITPEAATAWLKHAAAAAPIEVAIVGDMPREEALELVRIYLGALPSREPISPAALSDLRRLERPTGPLSAEQTLRTQTDKALVMCGFYGTDYRNIRDVRLLNMAGRILTTRAIEDIREKKQLAYSPGVSSHPGVVFPGFGLFATGSTTAPDKATALAAAIREMYDAFARDGPTEEEMQTARRQMANTLDEQMREPGFWLGAIANLSYRGTRLEDIAGAPEAYQALTAEGVKDAFNRYDKPANRFTISVFPRPPEPTAAPQPAPQTVPRPD
jgi:zinc protease